MSEVTNILGSSSSSNGAANSAAASAALTQDFDTFIQLLTTQVTNQDPLEPLDSTQFVEQLATFSGLEQQIATNSHLESIASILQAQFGNSGALLIGENVSTPAITAQGPFDPLVISAPEAALEGALVVRDSSGEEIYRSEVSNEWSWDGTLEDGAAPLDTYTFEVETPRETYDAVVVGRVDRILTTQDGQVLGLGDNVTTATYTVL